MFLLRQELGRGLLDALEVAEVELEPDDGMAGFLGEGGNCFLNLALRTGGEVDSSVLQ